MTKTRLLKHGFPVHGLCFLGNFQRARISENLRESARICVWARFVPLGSSPCARPLQRENAQIDFEKGSNKKHQIHATSRPPSPILGTEKVPQRNFVTKMLPNGRVNFLVRFASKPLFYWIMSNNPLELFRKFFGAVRANFWLCGSFLAPLTIGA